MGVAKTSICRFQMQTDLLSYSLYAAGYIDRLVPDLISVDLKNVCRSYIVCLWLQLLNGIQIKQKTQLS